MVISFSYACSLLLNSLKAFWCVTGVWILARKMFSLTFILLANEDWCFKIKNKVFVLELCRSLNCRLTRWCVVLVGWASVPVVVNQKGFLKGLYFTFIPVWRVSLSVYGTFLHLVASAGYNFLNFSASFRCFIVISNN